MPQTWGQTIAWSSFPPSAGFDSATQILLSQNSIRGPLPQLFGRVGSAAATTVNVCDNLARSPCSYAL